MFWNTKKFAQEKLSLKMLKHAAPILSPLIQEQIKQRVLLSIQSQPVAASARFIASSPRFSFAKLMAASAFGILAIVGTAYASIAANPGDILYPVKRAQETVHLTLAPSEETKAQLQATFARERILEVKNITKVNGSDVVPKVSSNTNTIARNSAKKEIKKTLLNLQATEAHLKSQGKTQAAMSVQKNIKSISLEAKKQNLIEESAEY